MDRARLERLLDDETEAWAAKPIAELRHALADVVAYQRGEGKDAHQFEVQLVENEPDYVHLLVSIDDGSFWRSFAPPTRGVIVRSDGRVER